VQAPAAAVLAPNLRQRNSTPGLCQAATQERRRWGIPPWDSPPAPPLLAWEGGWG